MSVLPRFLTLLLMTTLGLFNNPASGRERVSFNKGWQFQKGTADGAENIAFDDSGRRTLDLPHDWAIEGHFDIQYNARSGGLPFHNTGWYRNTWLTITDPVRVPFWGTYVTTPTITSERAEVRVETQVFHGGSSPVEMTLHSSILDPSGVQVESVQTPLQLLPGETRTFSPTLEVPQPQLWEMSDPRLYTVVSRIAKGAIEGDYYETQFGIRTVS